ncbi:MAG: hypothetical protein JRN67_00540, partial [Nitrososphaerota archaeon]|nr:hypothetical protein [Nitrososphaerota archaeon]
KYLQIVDTIEIDLEKLIVSRNDSDEAKIMMNQEERNLLVAGGRLGQVKERLKQRLLTSI